MDQFSNALLLWSLEQIFLSLCFFKLASASVGCTPSIILFLSVINVVIEYVCAGDDFLVPPVKGYG